MVAPLGGRRALPQRIGCAHPRGLTVATHSPAGPSNNDPGPHAFIPATFFARLLLFARLGMGLGGALGTALLASALLQGIPVAYLVAFIPSPPERTFEDAMNDRFVRAIIEEEEEEEEEEEIVEEEEEEEEEVEAPAFIDEVAAPEPEPEPEPVEEEIVEEVVEEPEPVVEQPPVEPGPPDNGNMAVQGIGGGGDGGGSGPAAVAAGAGTGRRTEAREERQERREERQEEREREEENRNRVQQVEDLSQPPCSRARRNPALPYPEWAREESIEGRLRIQCMVTLEGELRGCRLRRGDERLFDYAKARIERVWRCSPGVDARGNDEQGPATFNVNFNLED